jgi:hypothetical protein
MSKDDSGTKVSIWALGGINNPSPLILRPHHNIGCCSGNLPNLVRREFIQPANYSDARKLAGRISKIDNSVTRKQLYTNGTMFCCWKTCPINPYAQILRENQQNWR